MRVQRIRKAYEQVADQLLAMITAGELKPGDRLPSEAELATDFGVSRTTVREALRILATRNLIHTRKGMSGGHFIVHPNVEGITDFLVANFGLLTASNTVTLEDLLQARELIEGPAAALAARNRTEDDLANLRASIPDGLDQMPSAIAMAHCRDFHVGMLAATGNQLLVVAAAPVFTLLQASAIRRLPTPEVIAEIARDHWAIYEAVEARDEDAARSRMDDHLGFLRVNYRPADGLQSVTGFDTVSRAKQPRRRAVARGNGAGPA